MPNNPQFPPITVLPVLLSAVSGALEASEEQLENFRRAKNKPYSLDSKTISDGIKSYTKQNESITHEKAMCAYWRSQGWLSALQKNMLNKFEENLLRMEEVNLQIITLANACALKMIEKLIDQEDADVAIDALKEWLSSSEEESDENDFLDDDDDDIDEEEENDDDDLDIDEVECHNCGETVANLIYADDVTSLQELEEYAANLLPSIKHQKIPTWIVADDDSGVMEEPWQEESLIKKIFPISTPAERISSERFDDQLDALAENHCDDTVNLEDEEKGERKDEVEMEYQDDDQSSRHNAAILAKLNETMTQALFELKALTELEHSRSQDLFKFVKTFLIGIISTSIDMVEIEQPGISTALYAEVEAIAKMGGLRAIADFQNKYSDRSYSVSQIAEDDMEAAMNYIGQELGSALSKAVNELPMPLRQQETPLRGIEALLSNVLNQRFTNPHEILDELCEHVHMSLDSLGRRLH